MAAPTIPRSEVSRTRKWEAFTDDTSPNERVRALLREVRGPDVLHVGCVGHKVAESAAERAHSLHFQLCRSFPDANVLGLDIDAAGIERMRQIGFRVEVGDAQNLKFDSSFDTILAGELIEHLQNPGQFLEGAARGLKPGGRLVLSTPNVFCVMLNLMYLYNRPFNPEHVAWFCPQTLRTILTRCGFCITKLDFVDDLGPELVLSPRYRAFAHAWMGVRALLPRRFRNTMVAVCKLA
jgi:2-polyprenyl-3-methyl-5-hydroxy-6-metoxy-1,4-benzoquinol methylase